MRQRVTIKEVAQKAQVSVTTVSHVLSGKGRVSQHTRDHVRGVAEQLGYQPHSAARSLRIAKFEAIGLLLPDRATSLEFYAELAMGAADAAFSHGYSVSLISPGASVEAIAAMAIDAVVVADPLVGDPQLRRLAQHLPVILCEEAGPEFVCVDLDHERLIAEVLDHFSSQGAGRIALLCPPTTVWWGRHLRDGIEAWTAANAMAHVEVFEMPFVANADEVVAGLDLALAGHPDALFVAQEGVAPLVLAATQERGLSVPADVLMAVGVDARDARFSSPPVTAIDLAPRECGELAVRLTEGMVTKVNTAASLVVRQSSLRL